MTVTCAGSAFQTRAAETGNARLPTVQRGVGGMTIASDEDKRSRCRAENMTHNTVASLS